MTNQARALAVLFATYAGFLIVMNALATKQFDIAIGTVTTGILVSPIVFMAQDVATEVFGYKTARRMILTGFAIMAIATALFQLAIIIPPSPFYANQEAFATIFGSVPRIVFASFLAYTIGSLVNAKVMAWMKQRWGGSLFGRAITSTFVGQLLDNAIFGVVAFAGVLPPMALVSLAVVATLFEVVYEIVLFPATKAAIRYTQRYIARDEVTA